MAGDRIQLDENVNPESTVLAELIRQTPPSIRRNFETRLRVMVSRGEPNITLLIEVATRLYDVLRMSGINVDFATSEERDPTTYDGLIEGNVGNGLESSPIPRSICDFSLSLNGDTLVTTVLSDLFDNGRLDRPDLQPIADQLPIENPEAIPRALGELTPDGKIGRAIMTTADDETSSTPGYYQLPIPPHLSGFVRCRPPDFQELSLATFVPGRQPGDTISAQHVTPPTTVFSTHIANTLGVGENLASTKQNFTDDTIGLSVAVVRENQMITDFNLIDHQNITNKEVGLVGFAATALYNIFLQNQIEIDYMKTLDDFINARAVDPDFLVNMFGISAAQADELAGIVNGAVDRAETVLSSNLEAALTTSRIRVRVTHMLDGTGIADADVTVMADDVVCSQCPETTDADGAVTLTLTGAPIGSPADIMVEAAATGFMTARIPTRVTAFSTVDADVSLSPQSTPMTNRSRIVVSQ